MNDTEKMNEANPSAAKLVACNERSRARVAEIAHLANECLLNTNHPNGYEQGQFGKDYRTFGRAMCEIRKLVRESIADVAPDYEMLALQFARDSFDFAKFQEALAAVASMKAEDFPGVYYTPGWLCELAKKLEGDGTVPSSSTVPSASSPTGADKRKPTMDFGRFHVTRAAIPGTTILTFRRKREHQENFATVVTGRIIVAKITRKDVGAEKPDHRFTVKSYMAGEKPRVLFAGDSWVGMSKTEKIVYKMVKCNIKETHRRRISRKRAAAAKAATATHS